MTDPVRAHLFVSGRVQGVSYRANAAAMARELGLRGWVRNLDDGRVELVAEGPPDRVDALVAWSRSGPRLAVVTGVELERLPATGEFAAFDVRR